MCWTLYIYWSRCDQRRRFHFITWKQGFVLHFVTRTWVTVLVFHPSSVVILIQPYCSIKKKRRKNKTGKRKRTTKSESLHLWKSDYTRIIRNDSAKMKREKVNGKWNFWLWCDIKSWLEGQINEIILTRSMMCFWNDYILLGVGGGLVVRLKTNCCLKEEEYLWQ